MSTELVSFLSMNGAGNEAISFYEKYFGAICVFKETYQDHLISHSVLQLKAGGILMINEEPLDSKEYTSGNGQSICIQSSNLEDTKNLFNGLTSAKGTQVIQKLAKVPFSPLFRKFKKFVPKITREFVVQ
ncbi:VOC family protein [Liquorilactobacillus satsumensis]|uniref:VOC family protein n=1 Tax=Liquorilactobacillus satsumensis TaxID=259059 RepID=UPI0021C2C26B|nr:VOC family protein [Liquorilactobacillus satsumensis]MCP9312032.1 VOC family protein [Liquorilactobacillus satsumensis]MCP9359166.1 VOC family protein [Liquorilactobacillus satsumensis]